MNGRPSSVRVFGSALVADPYSPQFKPYVYGGSGVAEPEEDVAAFQPQPCGTSAAAHRHYQNREPLCDACRDAERERWREAKRKRAGKPMAKGVFTPDKCGTNAGHQRHMYYGIVPCEECVTAHREYQKARRIAKKKEAAA